MTINIGWLLLGLPVVFLLGLFIGENWSRWDRASRRRHEPDEHEGWWDREDEAGKPDWMKREAD